MGLSGNKRLKKQGFKDAKFLAQPLNFCPITEHTKKVPERFQSQGEGVLPTFLYGGPGQYLGSETLQENDIWGL